MYQQRSAGLNGFVRLKVTIFWWTLTPSSF